MQYLSNAVRHFETQFALGELEAVAFDEADFNASPKLETKEIGLNDAYPIGHPMNAKFG